MSGVDEAKAAAARAEAAWFLDTFQRITGEVHRFIVGQDGAVDGVLTTLLCHGHALLEGVPGIGKTMLVRTLARALDLSFSRIQFTPDLLPADIVGAEVLEEAEHGRHAVVFREGPVVANLLLADEINRATPKTQSALLEAMQERQVTVGRMTRPLPDPFVVLATQNPIEQEGTYPLPEAQLDRFLMKIKVGYPREEDYHEILKRTTEGRDPEVKAVADAAAVAKMRQIVISVPVPDQVRIYAIRLVMATQPGSVYAPEAVRRWVALGSSPRGVQGLALAAKVGALLAGRSAAACADVRAAAPGVLRHRVLLNFEARAAGVDSDQVVQAALAAVPETGA